MHGFPSFRIASRESIQGFDGRHVGNTTFFEINDHVFRIVGDIKFFLERGDGAEKQGTIYFIMLPTIFIHPLASANANGIVPSKQQCRYDHTDQNSQSQVVQHRCDNGNDEHDQHITGWHPTERTQRRPLKRSNGDHDHEPCQRSHRQLFNQWSAKEDKDQEHNCGDNP